MERWSFNKGASVTSQVYLIDIFGTYDTYNVVF